MKNSSSIRAIQEMARISAKEAEIRKAMGVTDQSEAKKTKKTKQQTKSQFQIQIKAFRNALTDARSQELFVIREESKPGERKAIFTVYRAADLELQRQEEAEYRKAKSMAKHDETARKPFRAQFVEMYVLYPMTGNRNALGSVAIYGEGAAARCVSLKKAGYLFGHRIVTATVESGRRPFVDVYIEQTGVKAGK